ASASIRLRSNAECSSARSSSRSSGSRERRAESRSSKEGLGELSIWGSESPHQAVAPAGAASRGRSGIGVGIAEGTQDQGFQRFHFGGLDLVLVIETLQL